MYTGMVQGGIGHQVCFDFEFYIGIFLGDILLILPRLKKGNVTFLTLLTHDEQIFVSYDVQIYIQALIKEKKIYTQDLRIGKEVEYKSKKGDSMDSKISIFHRFEAFWVKYSFLQSLDKYLCFVKIPLHYEGQIVGRKNV